MTGGTVRDRVAAIEATYHNLARRGLASTRAARLRALLEFALLPHYFTSPPRFRLWLRGLDPRPRVQTVDFALQGAVKSGTTAVTNHLIQHPCVLFPLVKEPPAPYPVDGVGAAARRGVFHATLAHRARVEREHGLALTGLFQPRLTDTWLPRLLHDLNPGMKIVLLLRNPIDRAHSHWRFDHVVLRRRGRQHYLASVLPRDFDELMRIELEALREGGPGFSTFCGSQTGYLQQGIYRPHVEAYLDRFGPGNVMVVQAEQLRRGRGLAVGPIFRFLGLPELDPGPLSGAARLEMEALAGRALPHIEARTRARLSAFYAPHNRRLYELIGRDLGWDRG